MFHSRISYRGQELDKLKLLPELCTAVVSSGVTTPLTCRLSLSALFTLITCV